MLSISFGVVFRFLSRIFSETNLRKIELGIQLSLHIWRDFPIKESPCWIAPSQICFWVWWCFPSFQDIETLLTVPIWELTLCFCLLGGFSDSDLIDGAADGGTLAASSLFSLSPTCCTQRHQGLQSQPSAKSQSAAWDLFPSPPLADASRT